MNDFCNLELQAKVKAKQYVASQINHPGKLSELVALRGNAKRKTLSAEASLNFAILKQTDQIKTGLRNLQASLQEIQQVWLKAELSSRKILKPKKKLNGPEKLRFFFRELNKFAKIKAGINAQNFC